MASHVSQFLSKGYDSDMEVEDNSSTRFYSILDQQNSVDDEEMNANLPSYLLPTVSSSLPPYLHSENERILNSYRTGTCWTIKKLPDKLQHGLIQFSRKQNVVDNLVSDERPVFKPSSNVLKNDFNAKKYYGTDYDKQSNINKFVVEEERMRTDSFARKPFLVSSRIRTKFEDTFDNPIFRFQGLGPGETLKPDALLRSTSSANSLVSIHGDKVLYGKYDLGTGRLHHTAALQVKEWATKIHRQIGKDWPRYGFRVRFEKSQELLVQFTKPSRSSGSNLPFPPPNNALLKYMLNMARNGLAKEFKLQKRGDRWNVLEVDDDAIQNFKNSASSPSLPPTNGLETNSSKSIPSSSISNSPLGISQNHEVTDTGERWFVPKSGSSSQLNTTSNDQDPPTMFQRQGLQTIQQKQELVVDSDNSNSNEFTAAKSTFARRMSRSMPTMETMFEENSLASSNSSMSNNDLHSVQERDHLARDTKDAEESDESPKVYLTFSFYAPWVNDHGLQASKSRAKKHRQDAREYSQKLAELYRPPSEKTNADSANENAQEQDGSNNLSLPPELQSAALAAEIIWSSRVSASARVSSGRSSAASSFLHQDTHDNQNSGRSVLRQSGLTAFNRALLFGTEASRPPSTNSNATNNQNFNTPRMSTASTNITNITPRTPVVPSNTTNATNNTNFNHSNSKGNNYGKVPIFPTMSHRLSTVTL